MPYRFKFNSSMIRIQSCFFYTILADALKMLEIWHRSGIYQADKWPNKSNLTTFRNCDDRGRWNILYIMSTQRENIKFIF